MRTFIGVFILVITGLLIAIIIGARMSIATKNETSIYRIFEFEEYPVEIWQELKGKKIFFGHQSVGYDLIRGMKDVVNEQPHISLEFFEISESLSANVGIINHCKIGRNASPESKVRAFRKILLENGDAEIDIALMKFCYVDVSRDSNPKEILDLYVATISELRVQFPDTVFVHMTVPVESMPQSAKDVLKHFVKMLLGRPGVVEDNRVRHQYNELLRRQYSGKEPVFDLAAFESVDAKGNLTVRTYGPDKVEFMDPQKTEDGGHLNEFGRKDVGGRLLVLLAEIASAQQ